MSAAALAGRPVWWRRSRRRPKSTWCQAGRRLALPRRGTGTELPVTREPVPKEHSLGYGEDNLPAEREAPADSGGRAAGRREAMRRGGAYSPCPGRSPHDDVQT